MKLRKRSPEAIGDDYHRWYYDTHVWTTTTWLGVRVHKSVSDMWNYQEILAEVRPTVVVEFGSAFGGSALFFSTVLAALEIDHRILTVDVDHSRFDDRVQAHPRIEAMTMSSTDAAVGHRIAELRAERPGPVFAIADSDHTAEHVHGELLLLHRFLVSGDYLIVEDGNINGHPVLPGWGPGPYEAVEAFLSSHPDDYESDTARENKFGFTFAPKGFLRRR